MNWVGILTAIAVVVVLFTIYFIWEGNHFVVTHYTVTIPGVSFQKEHTLLLVADLHNKQYGVNNETLIRAMKEAEPDVILGAGDFVVSAKGKDTKRAELFLKEIADICPVYYGMGNHERKMYEHPEWYPADFSEYENYMKALGIHLLRDESETFEIEDCKISVAGLDMERLYYRKIAKVVLPEGYMQSKLGEPDEDCQYHILLAHNPEFFKDYAEWGADLVCSGHVHGGIARLPFLGGVIAPSLKLFPKYDGGVFEEYGSKMILSRGLGTHTIPIRFANPPELVVLHLK